MRNVRMLLLLGFVGASVWGLFHIEYAQLFAVLRRAPPALLLLGAMFNFVNLCGKASSWYFLLPRNRRPRYLRLLRYSVASGAFSVVAPLRAGEGLRIFLLADREGVPASLGIGTALTEKLLNVLGLVVLVLPLPWLLPGLPPWLTGAALGCALFVALLAFAMRYASHWLQVARWPRVHAAFSVVRGQRAALVPAFACLMLGWLGDCALVHTMLRACDIVLSVWSVPFVLFVINLAIVVPSTPAQMGTLELAAVTGLRFLGVGDEPALAFGLLYHAVQVVPLLAVVAIEAPLLRDAARRMVKR